MVCLLNSALGLWFFIRRGKQCLDFTVTVHFFHMIGCWVYNSHLPASLSWWLVNVACMALMAVIGEYLCMQTELRAIPVNTGPKSNLWETVGISILWVDCVERLDWLQLSVFLLLRYQWLHLNWPGTKVFCQIEPLCQWAKNAPVIRCIDSVVFNLFSLHS